MNDPFGISKMIPKDPRAVVRAGRRLKNIKYSKEYEKRYQRSKSYSPPFLPGNKRATPEWNNYVARDKESYLSTGKIINKSQIDGKYIPATQLSTSQRKQLKVRAGSRRYKKPIASRGNKPAIKADKLNYDPSMVNAKYRDYSRMRKPDLERTHTKVKRNVYVPKDDTRGLKAAQETPKMRRPTVVTSRGKTHSMLGAVATAQPTGSKSSPRLITVQEGATGRAWKKDKKGFMTHEAAHANTKRNVYRQDEIVSNKKKLLMEEGRADAVRHRKVGRAKHLGYGVAGRTGGYIPAGNINDWVAAKNYRKGRKLAKAPITGPAKAATVGVLGATAAVQGKKYWDKRKDEQ